MFCQGSKGSDGSFGPMGLPVSACLISRYMHWRRSGVHFGKKKHSHGANVQRSFVAIAMRDKSPA